MSFISRTEIQTFLPKYTKVFNLVDSIMETTQINWIYYSCYDDVDICVHILVSDKGDLVYVYRKIFFFDFEFDFIKRRFDYEGVFLCQDRDIDVARNTTSIAKSQIVKAIDKRLLKVKEQISHVN
jgi:hypothetical protein